MPTRLTIATLASAAPMGAQVYEEEIARRAPQVAPELDVRRTVVRSLRSDLPGTDRLPAWVLGAAPSSVRRAAGRLVYPRSGLVHRMGLSLPPAPGPEVVTIHDTVAWRFPDEGTPEPHAAVEARRAAAVVSVSRFSADDVAERLGLEHVDVVHNGVDDAFFHAEPLSKDDLARLGVERPYVLHAGGSSQRKNLDGLAAAWRLVERAVPDALLVLSGPPSTRRDALFGPSRTATRVGRVPSRLVPGLVAGARAVVVPSLYEGFGLPAIEAMACGVPVVAADRSSLPEVCGDAALLVEPDADGIAEALIAVLRGEVPLSDMIERGRARARSFTWEASATKHAEIWRRVLAAA